ncbi:NAD(+) diphosphatase [Agaribacterium sp. ZY112]|uniref:NAD(+) diphosphatase n=1 Tax=Agaribacterium sp. ZY112 TaxID=3233574 RepID=UPI0035241FDB
MTFCLSHDAWLSETANSYILIKGDEIAVKCSALSKVGGQAEQVSGKAYVNSPSVNELLLDKKSALSSGSSFNKLQTCSHVANIAGQSIGLWNLEEAIELPQYWQWLSIRAFLKQASEEQALLASRGVQLAHWLQHNKYCGSCGGKTQKHTNERALQCGSCERLFFPDLAPCVIGVIVREDEILLANGINHKPGVYSAIAGFIEVGETAEQAFIREVKEEVGVNIKNIRYHSSQAWPFPSQLMLGFIADYAGGDIHIDTNEIVHASWFKLDDLPTLPGHYTISRHLIDHALKEGSALCI